MTRRLLASLTAGIGLAVILTAAAGCKSSEEECHGKKDPVCHMSVPILPGQDPKVVHEGKTYCFCNDTDAKGFKKDPKKYLAPDWKPRMLKEDEVK
jgi:YHS domain-containing protein